MNADSQGDTSKLYRKLTNLVAAAKHVAELKADTPLTAELIMRLHTMVMQGLQQSPTGVLRTVEVRPAGSHTTTYAHHTQIESKLK
jgi:hypothetical protein